MENNKHEIIAKTMDTINCYPMLQEDVQKGQYTKVPLENIAALGIAFEPIKTAFQTLTGNVGGSGLYHVTIPPTAAGGRLVRFADGSGFMGGVKTGANPNFLAQARLNPVAFNPATLCMAMAIMNINKKLDQIQETQKEILEFLQQKEKAKLKGNLLVLQEIIEEYRFNWDNSQYKNNKHIQVQEIKRDSEQSIIMLRGQIEKEIGKKSLIHSDHDVKTKISKIQSQFSDYELAVYIFSFASFLEVMLLENFDKGYLNSVANKLSAYAGLYGELYEKCYDMLESASNSSVQAYVLKGVAGLNKSLGKAIAKIPKVSDGQVDENLIAAGEKVEKYNVHRAENTMEIFVANPSLSNKGFIDNIYTVRDIYNNAIEMVFDHDTVYLETKKNK